MATRTWTKLGLIAGGGDLPVRLAEHCRDGALPLHVSRISAMSDPRLRAFAGSEAPIASIGERIKALKADGVDAVVFAGLVKRPDFATLKPDLRGALALPRLIAEARKGDDALLRAVLQEFEKEGFQIVGADEVLEDLLATEGLIAARAPTESEQGDIAVAARIAAAMGALDIGQGAVVCDGLVLAVEAQEGTDAMLTRVAHLPADIRGSREARRGVLCKRAKPIQERRVDLPTVGLKTVDGVARAGLAGIAVEAGGALIIDRPAVVAAADEAGLFLVGFAADTLADDPAGPGT
jgi:UDP-2,3-diacylglucosamine hydrolase